MGNGKYWIFIGCALVFPTYNFFYIFLQINNNTPYFQAVPTKYIFCLKFLCASHLKIKHFEFPPANKMPDWKVCRAQARNHLSTFWSAPATHAHFRLVMLACAHMTIMPAQTHAKKF